MKIIVLSGPGEVNKRAEMLKIKQQFASDAIIMFDLKTHKLAELMMAISAQSLFDDDSKLIIVENTADDLDLKTIVKPDNSATLLFLIAAVKATSKLMSSAKQIHAQIINFDAEKEISAFAFLDALIEGRKEAFSELQKLQEAYGGMYILSMIYYLLRRNLLPLPESSFMQQKIKNQKKNYSSEDFQKLYLLTLKTDFAIKSGTLPENIALTKLTQEFVSYLR